MLLQQRLSKLEEQRKGDPILRTWEEDNTARVRLAIRAVSTLPLQETIASLIMQEEPSLQGGA